MRAFQFAAEDIDAAGKIFNLSEDPEEQLNPSPKRLVNLSNKLKYNFKNWKVTVHHTVFSIKY